MSTIMNFILEGNLKQTVLYTYSTIMNFILEGKLCFTETKRLCRITLIKQALRRFLWAAQLKFDFDADKLLMNCKICANFV